MATRDAREILTLISTFRAQRFLRKYHPMAVICTQAVPAVAMAAAKKRGTLKVPLICVVTDFGVHTYWYHHEVDLYLVAHEDVKQEMVNRGISEHRIRVTGIPIHPKFGETFNAVQERQRLRISAHTRTLLIMGGSHGLGPLDETVKALKTIPFNFQAVVVCGRNRPLQKKIQEQTENVSNFHVFGYVRDLPRLMSAADILITKPGGLTCSEALAKQLPMVLTNPLPGQEERNVRFLMRRQVAKLARTPEDLVHTVSDLLRHPKKIRSMQQRAKLISKPHSAWEAARVIFDVIHRRESFVQAQG
jgi:processive 1,2-diacylglycerol beta-glucosyltransferase